MQIQSASASSASSSLVSANDSIKKQRQDSSQILLSSSSDATSRALSKIEDAKQEIEFLKRYGFPPQVIARIAGELAHSVGAAAQEFSQAAGAAATASTTPGSPSVDGAATLAQTSTVASDDPASGTTKDASSTNDSNKDDPDSVDAKQAKLAYRATADDGAAGSNASSGDQKIMDQFSAILAEIKALLDKAKRDMQTEKSSASQTTPAVPEVEMTGQQSSGIPSSNALFI